MKIWIYQNMLALYGAIVGTIALLINLLRLVNTIKKDKIKLVLSVMPHPEKDKNIEKLTTVENKTVDDMPNLVEIFQLKIRNIGNVDAYIEDAGIVCNKGEIHQVFVPSSSTHCVLNKIPKGGLKVQPKAAINLSVYLKKGEEVFHVKKAFAFDSTGKEWTIKPTCFSFISYKRQGH